MQAQMKDLKAILVYLTGKGIELVAAVDVNLVHREPSAANVKLRGFDAYTQYWQETHHNDAPGNLAISILVGRGGKSPLTDPVDVQCSGLKDFIAKHTPGAGPTPVA